MQADYNTTERVALLTFGLALGTAYTTSQVADLTGMTWGGAYRMLCRVSGILPIYQDETGCWRILGE